MRSSAIFAAVAAISSTASAAAVAPALPDSANWHPKPAKTCLVPDALQTSSYYSGTEEGTPGYKPGMAPSETDRANFINFCAGYPLTNGKQVSTASCNGIPHGRIPAKSNMISAIITSPQPGATLPRDTAFNVTLQTAHLRAGYFTNPQAVYYAAPQQLDEAGDVIGHCHITIQSLGESSRPTAPPDPTTFAFFKGIDDEGDGQGGLQTEVTGGLAPGHYRLCSMIAARNHQPVLMPVAQRGAQDDCVRFDVV